MGNNQARHHHHHHEEGPKEASGNQQPAEPKGELASCLKYNKELATD